MNKDIIILGESHTRSFAYRENIIPFFMDTGKLINLETQNLSYLQEKINQTLSKLDLNKSIVFLYIGEPNCRIKINGGWTPHWDELHYNKIIKPYVDEEYLIECIDNYTKLNLDKIDYILTPTCAYDPINPAILFFNNLLKEKFKDKVIDIFTQTVDENLKVLHKYKAKDWKGDPIHVNSRISEDLLNILKEKNIIDNVEYYKSNIDGYFGTHLLRDDVKKTSFGSFIIKD